MRQGLVLPVTLDELLADYDWGEAFAYATPRAVLGYAGGLEAYDRKDVAEILCSVDGEHDAAAWVGVFRLTDGRFAVLRASCDYTGWDCQAGGDSEVAATFANLFRWALTTDERERLGFCGQHHGEPADPCGCQTDPEMSRDCRARRDAGTS